MCVVFYFCSYFSLFLYHIFGTQLLCLLVIRDNDNAATFLGFCEIRKWKVWSPRCQNRDATTSYRIKQNFASLVTLSQSLLWVPSFWPCNINAHYDSSIIFVCFTSPELEFRDFVCTNFCTHLRAQTSCNYNSCFLKWYARRGKVFFKIKLLHKKHIRVMVNQC